MHKRLSVLQGVARRINRYQDKRYPRLSSMRLISRICGEKSSTAARSAFVSASRGSLATSTGCARVCPRYQRPFRLFHANSRIAEQRCQPAFAGDQPPDRDHDVRADDQAA
jgi:hypothetical protein